jgi:hypothetical protein
VRVPLLGRYKGEMHMRYYFTPLAAMTNSGIQVRVWLNRLVAVWLEAGRTHGPAFGTRQGEVLEASLQRKRL